MDPYRLPGNVIPSRYELRLEPDLESRSFAGDATIYLNVIESVAEIVLNAAELTIASATLEGGKEGLLPATIALEEPTERCRLTLPKVVDPGDYRLRLCFNGTLNDKLRGFYHSTYRDAAGAPRHLAATQFEATDARRAFPCWDEPAFKAVFSTTLAVDPALKAISNSRVHSESIEAGKRVVRFADTMPLSTYLVAFVVGDLEATEPILVGKTPLSIWCVPGKNHLTAFAQAISAFSLGFFERYYGMPYPGDKLDLLAIPDFAAGAMENLGAITFRETALLVDASTATHAEQERVADVVSHEIAHMWFGDLVTMGWWNGLWLNEAFATFMEMAAVDAWRSHWDRWTTFGASRSAAFAVDGLHATRPIEFPVAAPRDADAMFDVLTYEKGASVLRMLEQYIGPEVFQKGVRLYLERHAYKNTETTDLWVALGEAAGLQVKQILDGWIYRPGHPIVTAERRGDHIILSQERFTYLRASSDSEIKHQRWMIPIQLRLHGKDQTTSRRVLLSDSSTQVGFPADCRCLLVNEGGHGFYRVHYAPELLAALLDEGLDKLAPIERFNLISDSWASVQAGLMPLDDYLTMTERFRGERDKNVWTILLSSLQTLNRLLEVEERPGFQRLVRDRLAPAFAELGWTLRQGDSELTNQLRGELLRGLGILGNEPGIQNHARALYSQPGVPRDANLDAAIVPIVAFGGDAAMYEIFFGAFQKASTPQIEQRYLQALTFFRQPELIERTLAGTLNGTFRTQDAPLLLRLLLLNVVSRNRAWQFIQEHWEEINRLLPFVGVRRLLEGLVGLVTPELERQAQSFVAAKKIDLGGKTLAQYFEQLRVLVALREREQTVFRAFLAGT